MDFTAEIGAGLGWGLINLIEMAPDAPLQRPRKERLDQILEYSRA